MADPTHHASRGGGQTGGQSDRFGFDGHVLSSEERAEVRRKKGQCVKCGLVQTHERPKRGFLRFNLKPVTGPDVYKGVHLPCYGGLVGAKQMLRERVTAEDQEYDRRRHSAVAGGAVATNAAAAAHGADGGRTKKKKKKKSPAPAATTTTTTAAGDSQSNGLTDSGRQEAQIGLHAPGLHPGMLQPQPPPHGHHAHQHHPPPPPSYEQPQPTSGHHAGHHPAPHPPQPHQPQPHQAIHPPIGVLDTGIGLQRFDSLSTMGAPSEYLDNQMHARYGNVNLGQPGAGLEGPRPDTGGSANENLARRVEAVNQYEERMALMRTPRVGGDSVGINGAEDGNGGAIGGGAQPQQQHAHARQQQHQHAHARQQPHAGVDGHHYQPASPSDRDITYSPGTLESPSGTAASSSSSSPARRKGSQGRLGSLRNKIKKNRLHLPNISSEDVAGTVEHGSQHTSDGSAGSGSTPQQAPANHLAAPQPPTPSTAASRTTATAPGPGGVGRASPGMADLPEMTSVPRATPPAEMLAPGAQRQSAVPSALAELESSPDEEVRRVAVAAKSRDYQSVLARVKTDGRTSAAVTKAACTTVRVGLVGVALSGEDEEGEYGEGDDDREAAMTRKESSKAGKGDSSNAKIPGAKAVKGGDDDLAKKKGKAKKDLARPPSFGSSSSRTVSVSVLRLLPGTWVKVLTHSASVEHATDASVQAEVIRTMWTLAALADRHKSDVKDCGGVEMTVQAMGRHAEDAEVQLYGSGLLGCLAESDRHGGGVKSVRGGVEALIRAATFRSSSSTADATDVDSIAKAAEASASECALRALLNLTTYYVRQGGASGGRSWLTELERAADAVANAVSSASADEGDSKKSIAAMAAETMKNHQSFAGVQAWSSRLLWALSSIGKEGTDDPQSCNSGSGNTVDDGSSEEEKREVDADGDKPSGSDGQAGITEGKKFQPVLRVNQEIMDAIKAAADHHSKDAFVAASLLGLLLNLSASSSFLAFAEMVKAAAESVVSITKANQDSVELLTSGCAVYCNLCADGGGKLKSDDSEVSDDDPAKRNRASLAQVGAVEAVVTILKLHKGNDTLDIQAEACRALTCLCVDSAANKDGVAAMGGIRVVIGAYRSQIGRSGIGPKAVRDRSCEVLATLAVGRNHVSTLNGSGVMVDLIKNALEEGLTSHTTGEGGGVAVPLVMLNLLSANCTSSSSSNSSTIGPSSPSSSDSAAKSATTSTVVKFVLQNYTGPLEAHAALSMLQCLTYVQRDCVDVVLRYNLALDKILGAMETFVDEADIQREGCGLLSNIYVHSKGLGHRDRSDVISLGLEVELIARALRTHPYREGVEERACLALRNFCAAAPLEVLANEAVMPVLLSAAEEAVRVLSRNASGNNPNSAVTENAAGFIWALARVSEAVCVAVASSPDGVSCIANSLGRYPDVETLQREAVGALEALSRIANTHTAIGSASGIDAILKCIGTYDNREEMVSCGVALLVALSSQTHQAKVHMIENENTIPRTIGCMYQYPNSALIQGSACSILANIAVDNSIKEWIVNEGGISLIQSVMNAHESNEWVVEKASEALGNLVSGAQTDILLGNDITQKVIAIAERYPDSERVQERCMAALWNLSVKGTEFKSEIAQRGGIPSIVRSMTQHIASVHVQEKGCVTLWSLAVSDANQVEIGREGGVGAVVNGALAHIGNAQLQSEAIGALRTLATNPENKERIRECDGVSAIVSAMWVHYTNTSLQESAFSALTNVAVNPVTNQVSKMSKNELEAITSAMKRFPQEENLQQQACILLRNYTFSAPNIELMKSNELLFGLLMQAGANHSEACSERVMYIVDQLF